MDIKETEIITTHEPLEDPVPRRRETSPEVTPVKAPEKVPQKV